MYEGHVYIFSNPGMPDLYKIGYTERKPLLRAKELSTTGVPYIFTVEYSYYFGNAVQAEQEIHKKLKAYRVNDDREFFNCKLEKAIEIFKSVNLSGHKSFSLAEYKEGERIRVERYKLEQIKKNKKEEDRKKQLDTWRDQRERKEREKEEEKLNDIRRRHSQNNKEYERLVAVAFIIALPITWHHVGYKVIGLKGIFMFFLYAYFIGFLIVFIFMVVACFTACFVAAGCDRR